MSLKGSDVAVINGSKDDQNRTSTRKEIAASHAAMAEAISLAKAAHDPHILALALWSAAVLGVCERNPTKAEYCRRKGSVSGELGFRLPLY